EIGFGPAQFYESFFWGGGHILQFLYVQIMLLAWWWLAQPAGFSPQNLRFHTVVLQLNLLVAIGSLLTYIPYPAYEPEHIAVFTPGMKHFGGLASILFALPLCAHL